MLEMKILGQMSYVEYLFRDKSEVVRDEISLVKILNNFVTRVYKL